VAYSQVYGVSCGAQRVGNLGKDRSPFELEEIRGCPPARREGHVLSLVIILHGRSHDMCGRRIVRHCLGVLDQ